MNPQCHALTTVDLESLGASEILNNLPDAAYITTRDRTIVFWSRAAEKITGWSAKEVVGRRCSDNVLVHVDKDGHHLCREDYCPLHRAIATGESSRVPIMVFAKHKDGTHVPVEVSVAPLRDGSGNTIGGIEVFRDLTPTMEDMRRAKVIQDKMLQSDLAPDSRVRFEVSYRPEELVGGDFYRVQRLSQDIYVAMVADVMGHGIASALYTMQMRSIWEECQAALGSPAEFLSAMNQRLHKLSSPNGYFATAVFMRLDLGTMQLSYVRAGHPAPILLPRNGPPRSLNKRSPAVGLMEHVSFMVTREKLARGDRLLLFTDGAVEINNASGVELGEAGLLSLVQELPATGMDLAQLKRKLLQYSNALRLPDDLTLLSVQLAGE